jgi:hypothetical protein
MIITNQFCYYLSAIPATSVPSESAFSTVTRLLDDYRSRLSADTVEALMINCPFNNHLNYITPQIHIIIHYSTKAHFISKNIVKT